MQESIKEKGNLVILFDEIDRCLPTYAIQILERINHLFNISGLTCLVAVDSKQLANTIKGIFGMTESVRGYLTRFIDYEIDLPKSTENENNLLYKSIHQNHAEYISPVIECFDFGLREKIKLITSFRLFGSMYFDRNKNSLTHFYGMKAIPESTAIIYVIAKCIRLKNEGLYKQLFKEKFGISYAADNQKKIEIKQSRTYKLAEYLSSVGLDRKISGSSFDWVKCIFMSAFYEYYFIENKEAALKFLNTTENEWQQYNRGHSPFGSTFTNDLKQVLKFIEELG